jgi:hypothetical protein
MMHLKAPRAVAISISVAAATPPLEAPTRGAAGLCVRSPLEGCTPAPRKLSKAANTSLVKRSLQNPVWAASLARPNKAVSMSLKPALGVPALGVLVLEIQGSFPAAVMLGTRASNGKQSKLNDVQIGWSKREREREIGGDTHRER